MYSSYQLKQNPSFRMTGDEFNTIINTITKERNSGDKPIKLALSIRTTHTNLVAKSNNSVVITSDLVVEEEEAQGYFRLTFTVKKILEHFFPTLVFEDIKNTVLLPIGVYEQNGELYVYMHLILQDNQVDTFTNSDIKYENIKDLYFDFNLDGASLIVLQTLNIVNEK